MTVYNPRCGLGSYFVNDSDGKKCPRVVCERQKNFICFLQTTDEKTVGLLNLVKNSSNIDKLGQKLTEVWSVGSLDSSTAKLILCIFSKMQEVNNQAKIAAAWWEREALFFLDFWDLDKNIMSTSKRIADNSIGKGIKWRYS